MTNNERIAKWAGWSAPTNPGAYDSAGLNYHIDSDGAHYTTELQRKLGRGQISCDEVHSAIYWVGPNGESRSKMPEFDKDITLWHDGLLDLIEARGVRHIFMRYIDVALPAKKRAIGELGGMWIGLTATPSQLTKALVATIKEAK